MKEGKKVKVSNNDNLYSIALKYNTSPSFLQIVNELYPPIFERNMEILIKSVEQMATSNHTIYAFFCSNETETPGTITFYEDSFVFQQKQTELGGELLLYPIKMDSILSSTLLPHPSVTSQSVDDPSQPANLTLCYSSNPDDKESVEVVIFSSSRAEMNALNTLITNRMKENEKGNKKLQDVSTRVLRLAELRSVDSLGENTSYTQLKTSNSTNDTNYVLGTPKIIDAIDVFALRRELPYKYRSYKWRRAFLLSEDGTSYISLYEKTQCCKTCVVVIKTADGSRIGCFLPQGLKNNERFYGNGETFVFHFSPDLKVYKWSRANESFISSTNTEILVGGGGGSAIWVDKYMHKGRSDLCETFNSPPLATKSYFYILDIEIWELAYNFHSQ